MRLLIITNAYPLYLKKFYCQHHDLAESSYQEQKAAFDYDAFAWSDSWTVALAPLGFEVLEITPNASSMQLAWAQERGLSPACIDDNSDIVIAQTAEFRPDILWFNDFDHDLLKRIRAEVPSIRLILGCVGSAIPDTDIWQDMDLVISCAPETVCTFRQKGHRAEHLNHAFDPRVRGRLIERPENIDLSFVGWIFQGDQFHRSRGQLLEFLSEKTNVEIFSPSADYSVIDEMKMPFLTMGYYVGQGFMKLRVPQFLLDSLPLVGALSKLSSKPVSPVNRKLKPYMRPAVFGLDMYQKLKDSKITLNIHADSSPLFASNMRLFEATGVGTCLLTDSKDNLAELFEPDCEVVTFESRADCIDKLSWLLAHPEKRKEIADAGRTRVLKEHTYRHRALQLNDIIKRYLSR